MTSPLDATATAFGGAPLAPSTRGFAPPSVSQRCSTSICYLFENYCNLLLQFASPKLFEKLWERGIQLVTKVKKNMKNKLLDFTDKLLLRKRAVIESVNDFLKNICQIEHSRYRSVSSFLINVISGLIAYSFLPSKPSLHISPFDQSASLVFS